MLKQTALGLLLTASLGLAACAPAAPTPAEAPAAAAAPTEAPVVETAPTEAPAVEAAVDLKDIVDTAVGAGTFSTLVAAVTAAELVETLKSEGPFTVFAPSDEAFAKLDKATLDGLLADPKGALTQILLYHVVPGKVMAASVTDGLEAETAQGGMVTFTVKDGVAMINDATIVTTDIEASNGVIHVIDSVILPPAEEAAEGSATEEPAEEAAAEMKDIVDTAVEAGSFTTLVTAVTAAELVDTLKSEGPFTVFAPNDEAFAKLDKATLDAALADPKGLLTTVLTYHVIPGKVMAADVKDGMEVATVQGGTVKFTVKDGKVMINDAEVVTTDIETSNGVIHVISSVILPPQ